MFREPESIRGVGQVDEKTITDSKLVRLGAFCYRTIGSAAYRSLFALCRVLAFIWPRAVDSSREDAATVEGSKRQLESSHSIIGRAVLSDSQDIFRTGGRGFRGEKKESNGRDGSSGRESPDEAIIMPVALLKPDTNIRVKYPVPRNGIVEYAVEADRPVSTFVLDEKGLNQFDSGEGGYVRSYYGGFSNRCEHHQELRLPFKGSWYLLIVNANEKEPAAVHYEVSG